MPNSKIRLYGLASFDRSAKVRWLLTALNLDFEMIYLDREKKEHEAEAFLKFNPMGRVPLLIHGDQILFESGAICTYLTEIFPEGGMAPEENSPDHGKFHQWMYFAIASIDSIQSRIMIIEDIPPGDIQQDKQTKLQMELRDALTALDKELKNQKYLVGDKFSAADIGVSYHLYLLYLWPELEVVLSEFPHIRHYVERMKKEPTAIKANVFSYPQ